MEKDEDRLLRIAKQEEARISRAVQHQKDLKLIREGKMIPETIRKDREREQALMAGRFLEIMDLEEAKKRSLKEDEQMFDTLTKLTTFDSLNHEVDKVYQEILEAAYEKFESNLSKET